jgi:hypothetical protein
MPSCYIYQADVYCTHCGEEIIRELGVDPVDCDDDSDVVPVFYFGPVESDSPYHCASGSDCLDAIELIEDDGTPFKIGALITDLLTDCGYDYVVEAQSEGGPVAEFWAEEFLG